MIDGVPVSNDAKVSVRGPGNFKSNFTASKTLRGLAVGDYSIGATNVSVGVDTYTISG